MNMRKYLLTRSKTFSLQNQPSTQWPTQTYLRKIYICISDDTDDQDDKDDDYDDEDDDYDDEDNDDNDDYDDDFDDDQ